MRLMARLRALYFELAYSLVTENHVIDLLEAISTVLEFFQIAAFIFDIHAAWGVPTVQYYLQYALLGLNDTVVGYILVSLVLVMDASFVFLLVQIARKGGISSFNVLQLSRVLTGVMSTFLFLPILEEGVSLVYAYIVYGTGNVASLALTVTVDLVGLLVPTFLVAYVQGPDHNRITAFSRASSRQSTLMLASKVGISVAFGVLPLATFVWILFFIQLATLGMALYLPIYFNPTVNLVWTGQQAALTYAAFVGWLRVLISPTTNPAVAQDLPIWFLVAVGGMVPAGLLGALAFKWRMELVLGDMGIWARERAVIRHHVRRSIDARRASTTTAGSSGKRRFGAALTATAVAPSQATSRTDLDAAAHSAASAVVLAAIRDIPVSEVLSRCRFPAEVVFAANTLFVTGGTAAGPYIVSLLAAAVKKFPDNEQLYLEWIAKASVLGGHGEDDSAEESVQRKTYIQGLIRRAIARTRAKLDTRFAYYAIIKNFEIEAFRRQSRDVRRMALLDIVRYHYNVTAASRAYIAALRWSYTFWKACAVDRPNVEALGVIADKLQEHQNDALHHYHSLLERFPSMVSILRSYAAFVLDVLNNASLSDEILEFADRIEDDKRAAAAAGQATRKARKAASAATGTTSTSEPNGGAASSSHPMLGHASMSASGMIISTSEIALDRDADTRSERSKTSSHQRSNYSGRSSDLVSTMNSHNIFDVESSDRVRNACAMRTISRLQRWVRVAFTFLFVVILGLYVFGNQFSAQEESMRKMVLAVGLLRKQGLVLVQEVRSLTFCWDVDCIVAQQAVIRDAAVALRDVLDSVFFSHGSDVRPELMRYWTYRSFRDATFSTITNFMTPLQLYIHMYLRSLEISLSNPPDFFTTANQALRWVIRNGLPQTFYNSLFDAVTAYQDLYSSQIEQWLYIMEYSAIVVACLPLLLLVFVILPRWFLLDQELRATTRLFARIPRRVAAVLASEAKERFDAKVEAEGLSDDLGMRLNTTGAPSPTKSGGAGDHGDGDDHAVSHAAGSSSSNATTVQLAQLTKSKTSISVRLLVAYVAALFGITALLLSLAFALSIPIRSYSTRAALVNYSGMRYSIMYRTMTELREFHVQQFPTSAFESARQLEMRTKRRAYWRASVERNLDMLSMVHRSVLYGNESLGLDRTLGMGSGATATAVAAIAAGSLANYNATDPLLNADSLTFTPVCADATNVTCFSFDAKVTYFSDVARRILAAKTVEDLDESVVNSLESMVSPTGVFWTQVAHLREVYAMANQGLVDTLGVAATWLFVLVFPLFFGIIVVLRAMYSAVRSRIRRTRGILFLLPPETARSIAVIRNYLETGTTELDVDEVKQTYGVFGSLIYGTAAAQQQATHGLHAAAAADGPVPPKPNSAAIAAAAAAMAARFSSRFAVSPSAEPPPASGGGKKRRSSPSTLPPPQFIAARRGSAIGSHTQIAVPEPTAAAGPTSPTSRVKFALSQSVRTPSAASSASRGGEREGYDPTDPILGAVTAATSHRGSSDDEDGADQVPSSRLESSGGSASAASPARGPSRSSSRDRHLSHLLSERTSQGSLQLPRTNSDVSEAAGSDSFFSASNSRRASAAHLDEPHHAHGHGHSQLRHPIQRDASSSDSEADDHDDTRLASASVSLTSSSLTLDCPNPSTSRKHAAWRARIEGYLAGVVPFDAARRAETDPQMLPARDEEVPEAETEDVDADADDEDEEEEEVKVRPHIVPLRRGTGPSSGSRSVEMHRAPAGVQRDSVELLKSPGSTLQRAASSGAGDDDDEEEGR
ncbi:hypothetical protein H9P43_002055 [Blastocladiella emersonii ATCC 22665]|nr:hypothetical protein H9P43_002055 [Blastocladiella emersonii ATCC 22665]